MIKIIPKHTRMKRGWPVEKALTTPVKSNTNSF